MPFSLQGARVIIRLPDPTDTQGIIDFFKSNQHHFAPTDPPRPNDFLTLGFWEKKIILNQNDFLEDKSCHMFLFLKDSPIGFVNLSNIVRGAFQACHLGYGISKFQEGQGLMKEGVSLMIRFAFEDLKLHRIMANAMVSNTRSLNLLESLGFEREGLARDYLFLGGKWQDHILTSLINSKFPTSC